MIDKSIAGKRTLHDVVSTEANCFLCASVTFTFIIIFFAHFFCALLM